MSKYSEIIRHLDSLATERVNPFTADLDQLDALEIVHKINQEDKSVAFAVERELDSIARVAEVYADTLRRSGRVFYVGAGTSGRLGVLDAAECPPTFGTDPNQIVGLIAGGHETLVLSKEGAEDNRDDAIRALTERNLSGADLVIGLAASVRTPYTLAGLEYAAQVGANTAFIVCNKAINLPIKVDHIIAIDVGPEAITGSTRMKSGTAQKMTLNLISTTAMVLLGKTYGNLMIDLQARSDKLAARSRKILIDLLGIDEAKAGQLLADAEGSVKTAIVMHKLSCDQPTAQRRLAEADGFVRRCIGKI
ncbi:MAG: N-acetylmuramic acid 6-phosphate etherase [bacterium]